jgi:hypothetical protein
MRRVGQGLLFLAFLLAAAAWAAAQSDYQVVTVTNAGTISGSVKWSGSAPRILDFPITKDPQICDPDSRKTIDLQRLIIGPQGGVANTVVYLKNISRGKALEAPEQRRHLDRRRCYYIPHILLVPENAALQMQSSDATLHTIHMVIPHPYYAVTGESGKFELTAVPPGTYQIVAWHEGWTVLGKEKAFDVLTEREVQRPVFTESKTWEKSVTVSGNQTSVVNFALSK